MNKIKSFCVDHRKLKKGIYLSRIDGDCMTYDLRFCKPNCGIVLDNITIHTVEHMLATFFEKLRIFRQRCVFWANGLSDRFLSYST